MTPGPRRASRHPQGSRYGLIGTNGSGKSNILAALAQRELPLPDHIDVYHLHEEAPATEQTGVEAVIAHVKEEVAKLEALSEKIMEECGMEDDRLEACISDQTATASRPSHHLARNARNALRFMRHGAR